MNRIRNAVTGPEAPRVQRSYKDSLFRMIFRDRNHLLSLYNAVNQTAYTDPDALTIVTLENAVYMNMKNDVAFLIGFELNLYEHQSTWNPNMPLRDLFYVAREYQMLLKDETLYSSRLVKIPVPHFIVFYNGSGMEKDSCILKLSDSFEKQVEEPELELKVQVLKIGPGQNEPLLAACQALKDYMIFVERVRQHAKAMILNEAVERAVNECIREGILADFLSKNRAEAIAMCIFEYDEEREQRLIRKAEYEEGHEAGLREGLREGKQSLLKNQIKKKLLKGKSPASIAEELEEDISVIETMIQELETESQSPKN